jgi:hypothetical protein
MTSDSPIPFGSALVALFRPLGGVDLEIAREDEAMPSAGLRPPGCEISDGCIVSIVVDPKPAERIPFLAANGPVWAIQSPQNEAVVRSLRAAAGLPKGHVTYFSPYTPRPDNETACEYILDTVDEHHPEWSAIVVYGAELTAILRAAFTTPWNGHFESNDDGFRFTRSI